VRGREVRPCGAGDDGSATVWAAIAMAALLVVTAFVYWIGAAGIARHRAAAAADLAALAAAGQVVQGVQQACARARSVTERMRVYLRECRIDGWDALVRVEEELDGPLAHLGPARARARAGPVGLPP
jgi:secretion/DNA translocation related TadE-like protein